MIWHLTLIKPVPAFTGLSTCFCSDVCIQHCRLKVGRQCSSTLGSAAHQTVVTGLILITLTVGWMWQHVSRACPSFSSIISSSLWCAAKPSMELNYLPPFSQSAFCERFKTSCSAATVHHWTWCERLYNFSKTELHSRRFYFMKYSTLQEWTGMKNAVN